MVSARGNVGTPQGGIWQHLKTFLIVTTGWRVLLADAEQSTMHSAETTVTNYLVQNVNRAQVEKLRSRSIACICGFCLPRDSNISRWKSMSLIRDNTVWSQTAPPITSSVASGKLLNLSVASKSSSINRGNKSTYLKECSKNQMSVFKVFGKIY